MAKPTVHDFETIKADILCDVLAVVQMQGILDELTFNWDHTPINIVPGSQ